MFGSIMSRGLPLAVSRVQLHASLHEALDDVLVASHSGQMDTTPALVVLQANITALEAAALHLNSHHSQYRHDIKYRYSYGIR